MSMAEDARLELLRKGPVKRIHVNQAVLRKNLTAEELQAPLTVQTSQGSIRAFEVDIQGPSKLLYSPDHPLACGARLWIETHALVDVRGVE